MAEMVRRKFVMSAQAPRRLLAALICEDIRIPRALLHLPIVLYEAELGYVKQSGHRTTWRAF